MNKLTSKEILSIIENNMSIKSFAHQDYTPEEIGLGKVENIDSCDGVDGPNWYIVQYFVEHDVYIKTSGYYSSYNGTYFDDGYGEEVKPIQKKIISYE